MIQDEFDNTIICRVLEVDDAYVDEVREQLNNEGGNVNPPPVTG